MPLILGIGKRARALREVQRTRWETIVEMHRTKSEPSHEAFEENRRVQSIALSRGVTQKQIDRVFDGKVGVLLVR